MTKKIRFIALPDVIEMTSLGKTSIYTLDFPKPVKIGSAGMRGGARWVEEEVLAWMASRIEARDSAKSNTA